MSEKSETDEAIGEESSSPSAWQWSWEEEDGGGGGAGGGFGGAILEGLGAGGGVGRSQGEEEETAEVIDRMIEKKANRRFLNEFGVGIGTPPLFVGGSRDQLRSSK